jgi:hypothetical protein
MDEKQKAAFYLSQLENDSFESKEEPVVSEKEKAKLYLQQLEEPAPKPKVDTSAKRYAARAARDVVAGAADIADLPFFLAEAGRYGAVKGAKKLGLNVDDTEFGKWMPNIGQKVANKIDDITGGYTKPQTKGERLAEAGTRALTGLPTGFGAAATLAKSAPKIAKVVKAIHAPTAGNIGATAGSSVASQAYLNENPNANPLVGALLAGLAGGYAGQKSLKTIESFLHHNPNVATGSRIGKMLGVNPEKVEQLRNIPISLGDVTDSKMAKLLQNKAENRPFASNVMQKFYEKQAEGVKSRLGVEKFPLNEEQAGELVHSASEKLQKTHYEKQGPLVEKFEKPINENLYGKENFVEAANTLGYNPEKLSKYVTPEEVKKYYKNSKAAKEALSLETIANQIEGKFGDIGKSKKEITMFGKKINYQDLSPFIKEQVTDALKDAGVDHTTQKGTKVTYRGLQDAKRNIDDMVTTYGQIGDMSQRDLKFLRGKIKQDLDYHFDNVIGGEAAKAWHDFNKTEHNFQKNIKPNINETFEKNKKGFTTVFIDSLNSVNSKGSTVNPRKLKNIYSALDDENKSKLFSSYVEELGRTNNGWNVFKVRKQFDEMRPIQQSVFLEGLAPNSRKDFKETIKAIDLIDQKKLVANTSGTAYHTEMGNLLDTITKGAKELGRVAIYGTAATPAGSAAAISSAVASLVIPYAGAKLFTNQKLLHWAAKSLKQKNANSLAKQLNKIDTIDDVPQSLYANAKNLSRELSKRNY